MVQLGINLVVKLVADLIEVNDKVKDIKCLDRYRYK